MRGVWRRACALCEAAPITRGAHILVIKGVCVGRVCGHIGQIRKITKNSKSYFAGAGGGPWGQGWSGDKKQSTGEFRSLGGRGGVRFRAQRGGVFRTVLAKSVNKLAK